MISKSISTCPSSKPVYGLAQNNDNGELALFCEGHPVHKTWVLGKDELLLLKGMVNDALAVEDMGD